MFRQDQDWDKAMKLWWAQTWRALPLAVFTCVPAGAMYHVLVTLLNVDPMVRDIMGVGLGLTIGMIMVIWVNKRLLIKGFGKYSLTMVEK